MTKEPYLAPPPSIARAARQRGAEIARAACAWCYRWGWVSNQTLEVLYPGRPRLGYELHRRGYFKQYKVPAGEHLRDGQTVYALTAAGREQAWLALPPAVLEVKRTQEKRVPWRDMQHRLDLQRIAVWFRMLPAQSLWWSDPENRVRNHSYADQCGLVPDILSWARMMYFGKESADTGIWWIEYDRTNNKSNIALNYWVQEFARVQQRALQERDPRVKKYYQPNPKLRRPELARISVIVLNIYQKQRYIQAFSNALVTPLFLDRKSRKIRPARDFPKLAVAELLEDKVDVRTFDEVAATACWSEAEEQRTRVRKSQFEPSGLTALGPHRNASRENASLVY